ncbi:MAG: STAS/SEC14 domain-containing protein [Deltaproteobacteria bacterium]|nr:STAS/SEC14 domain-containing protein [Deltaproteobacteria bacterium]
MIEVMAESQGNVIGVRISGKITTREYEDTIIPRVEAVLKEHAKVRFMYVLDGGFQGAEAGAMWDDTKLGLKHRHDFEKVAMVGGARWMEWLTKLCATFISGEIKTFPLEQLQEAWVWLKS